MLGEAVTPPILLGIVCFLAGSLVSILPDILRGTKGRARPAWQGRPPHNTKEKEGRIPMQFTPIDLSTWPRREHFHYYRNQLPCGYSVTVQLDVTRVSGHAGAEGAEILPQFHLVRVPYNPLPPRLSDGRGQ